MTECSYGWGVVKSLAIRIPRTGPTSIQGFFLAHRCFRREKSDRVLAADRTRRKRLLHPILADRRKRPGQLQ